MWRGRVTGYRRLRRRPAAPPDAEVVALLRACRSARDRFIVLAMARAGLRRGELCGLRREDMHLVTDATMLGCPFPGAHLHVHRRDNANGAWAKSRRARVVPVDELLVLAYDSYWFEREDCRLARGCDFVLVNLFRGPLGAPMRPGALNELLTALSGRAGLSRGIRPHMLRHAFGSNVLDAGGALDEAQALLGHISPASTQVYLHPSGDRLRQAVERVAARTMPRPARHLEPHGDRRAGRGPARRAAGRCRGSRGSSRPGLPGRGGLGSSGPGPRALPDHPLLGFRVCLVRGCQSQGLLPEELCATCRGFYRQSELGMAEFIAAGPVRARWCGEVICGVNGCPRPVRNRRVQLCYTHEQQRCRLQLPLAAFLAHPEARPLPTFGPCQVTVCTRQAHGRRGLCRAHDCRWWEQERAGKITRADFGAWCRSSAPVASGHEVILRGLAPLVQAQILFGLQERCRFGAVTYLYQLRIFCRRLLAGGCATIAGFDVALLQRNHRALVQDLQQAIRQAGTSPEEEQRKDVWNTAVLGHGRRCVIDFTGISQVWLREAVKR